MRNIKAANRLKIDTVIKNLEKRGMQGHYCETKEEACEKILSMIEDDSVVSWGGSVTINSLGVKEKLAERNVKTIDPYSTVDPAESIERRRQGLLSDYYLMSSNAVTMDGELINIDGTCNRVAALCFGPNKVIIVAGANKIVTDQDEALKRTRLKAAVPNAVRLGRKTPCTITGMCSDCLSNECICCNTVITRFCSIFDRLHVILINESLGY